MVKTRIIKKQDKVYVELPSEMLDHDEVEIFQLKEGFYLLSIPLEGKKQDAIKQETKDANDAEIGDREKTLLRKLMAIRFENRTPAHVLKTFSESELETLKLLEKKGLVNMFKGKKYVDGVYNIPDNTYSLLQKSAIQISPNPPSNSNVSSYPIQSSGALAMLNSRGFIIVNDRRDALTLSEQLSQEMKKGLVFGVKGFDNKFYIVTRDYLTLARTKISAILKKDTDLQSIAMAAKLDADGCSAALRIMAENGDIIEKKKGVFAPV